MIKKRVPGVRGILKGHVRVLSEPKKRETLCKQTEHVSHHQTKSFIYVLLSSLVV